MFISKNFLPGILGVVFAGIIALFVLNNSVYYHSHKLPDGQVVSHAHPYQKSQDTDPYKAHQHARAELFFLDEVNLLFFVTFLAALLFRFESGLKRRLPAVSYIPPAQFERLRSRGPPSEV